MLLIGKEVQPRSLLWSYDLVFSGYIIKAFGIIYLFEATTFMLKRPFCKTSVVNGKKLTVTKRTSFIEESEKV